MVRRANQKSIVHNNVQNKCVELVVLEFSAKDSDQLRSTNVTARLESDGEIWLPMPAPLRMSKVLVFKGFLCYAVELGHCTVLVP